MIRTARAAPRRRPHSNRPPPVALDVIPPESQRAAPRRLPRLKWVERHSPALRPNPLSQVVASDVDGLNLSASCPQQCVFCYARAYPGQREAETFDLYANTPETLRAELRAHRRLPRAVYLCPSTDPFPPYVEAQVEACRVVETLAEHGVEAWIMTRGFIRPFALEMLARHAEHVRVTVPVTTLDNGLRRLLEPLTAPPRLRLKQLRQLRKLGIRTAAAIEPFLPGLTDTRANLEPLLDALAAAGIGQVTASYMFLRHGIRENLERELDMVGLAVPLLEAYETGPMLPMGPLAPARHLPLRERQRGYGQLMALAAGRGIRVSVSALSNPDFAQPSSIPHLEHAWRQRELEYAR